MSLSREIPLRKGQSAILVIDLQCMHEDGGPFKSLGYFRERLKTTVFPSLQKLLPLCRSHKMDVIYTFIECLTKDCRDQSLDYKLSGLHVPKGSPLAAILPEVAPEDDDILIPKTSCSVFNSTNIEYVLRNLGVTQLVITGAFTNQCVESAVRDAADRGFYVTLVEDGVATYNEEDHLQSLKNMKGFSRIVSHDKLIQEIESWPN